MIFQWASYGFVASEVSKSPCSAGKSCETPHVLRCLLQIANDDLNPIPARYHYHPIDLSTHTTPLPVDHTTHNTANMSARFGIRAFRAQMPARQVNTNMRFAQRRTYQSVAENPNNVEAPAKEVGKLAQIWNSPVGPKTVHFWAPIMKVGCDMTFLGLSEERISRHRDRANG